MMRYYVGKHDILKREDKVSGSTSRIIDDKPRHLIDTYNGFFTGIEPKITLDDESENESLQDWNMTNSVFDKLSELSKQVDIFGRAYFYVYQYDEGHTGLTVSSPNH